MNQRNASQDKELLAIIERFEAMREEGKILYLDSEQYESITEYYMSEKKSDKASDAVTTGLKIHPHSPRLIALQVALYIDEENIEEARKTINKVLDDTSVPIQLIHVELLVVEGKEDEALKIIDSFQDDDIDDIDCLDIGLLCVDMDFLEKAAFWLNKSLTINPKNDDTLFGLCECYQAMGRYEETIDIFNKLIDNDPYSSDYWLGLARSYFNLEQPAKVIEACDFAIVANEKTGEAHTLRAHAFYQLENYQEAVETYKEAWRLGNLESDYAPLFVAFCYIGLEQWDNAYEYCKKAIARINEDSEVFSDLLLNTARCLQKMNRYQDAHGTLEFAQQRFPKNITPYLYDAKFYLEEDNRDMAINMFHKALDINPEADTWYQIGTIALSCADYELAEKAFTTVEELNPGYGDLPHSLGNSFFRLIDNNGRINPTSRKKLKAQLRIIAEKTGIKPERYDVEQYIRQAKEEGKDSEAIESLIKALELLNDIVDNYDIDQEEDETGEINDKK